MTGSHAPLDGEFRGIGRLRAWILKVAEVRRGAGKPLKERRREHSCAKSAFLMIAHLPGWHRRLGCNVAVYGMKSRCGFVVHLIANQAGSFVIRHARRAKTTPY